MGVQAYITSLLPGNHGDLIDEMEKYAAEHHVPIMEQAGMQLLLQMLEIHQPKSVLEIGTAIGYSAIRMAQRLPDATIITLERDEERIETARKNIAAAGLDDRVIILAGDALQLSEEASSHGPFDALFIDAAKGQYERFFELYEPMVSEKGMIISDNILFKGMVAGETEIPHKRTESMVKKLRRFNENLMQNPKFSSMIYPVGDGVLVSIKNRYIDK